MITEMVLCAIIPDLDDTIDEQDLWMDLDGYNKKSLKMYRLAPVIDHPHSDKENGQNEIHYHKDMRYDGKQPYLGKNYSLDYGIEIRPLKGKYKFEKFKLVRYSSIHKLTTGVDNIKNSKLKHKCIYKGKCPHRGFDLSNENPDENGIITCPLHSLRFDSKNNNKIIS